MHHVSHSHETGHSHSHGAGRALIVGALTLLVCLTLASVAAQPVDDSPAYRIAGMSEVPSLPPGRSWAPAPVTVGGLRMVATAGNGAFDLHTAGADVDFLPGVNLGSTLPGDRPGELSITASTYRSWFAAMSWLGIRVVRIYTIHPPAFYAELAAHNEQFPDRPIYLIQGVQPPDESFVREGRRYDPDATEAFRQELRDAAAAVSGHLIRRDEPGQGEPGQGEPGQSEPGQGEPGRVGGSWRTDITPWLAAWIIGPQFDQAAIQGFDRRNVDVPAVDGTYFRSTADASPTERWLTARMDELAGLMAARGISVPLAFVNSSTTDPLVHPDEPPGQGHLVGLDANHVRPTAAWPGGTFASYHAYPYSPDLQRHDPALLTFEYAGRADPYAGYVTALKRHHGDLPVMITEFGVPSSIGSAQTGPLGRSQGDHSEATAMQIDAELLRLIRDAGLAGGLLSAWTDEWSEDTGTTGAHQDGAHQDPELRRRWHDPLTAAQHAGLIAMDAAGQPDAAPQTLLDEPAGWPAHTVTARVDEAYLTLRIMLGGVVPDALTVGLDVLPELTGSPAPGTGSPAPGTGSRSADAAFALNLTAHTGQAYLRDELDPLSLDGPVVERAPAPAGWQQFQSVADREPTGPAESADAGVLRYGPWDPAEPEADSRALWRRDGNLLVLRVPWAMAGFADPSAHRIAVPRVVSPGVAVTVSASDTDQATGVATWSNWQRVRWSERLKQGADYYRDALSEVGG